ncbi:LysR family transcriptional regulator [Tropicimonas isoalkanivorans]|uniref:DNA-binding transcriptional regulator, LysR family n=1 Tax=Tropicimonas isoalkanivorans TaxID=441112 RepID=A0A1I1H436_9RHOB|nr:LysR family transcriptional regulator [Tropicimonas isoalkanivorans]SFC18495.1 DNA-binding transcriptional regulator, LysR family [Tropicimonas isoalkanivorans]
MLRDMNMNALRHFEAVARRGRVSKAAEELRVTTSAVSQQIRLLEQQFGVLLFRRENRRLIPTEEGERLYIATSQAFRMVAEVHSAIVRQRQMRQFIMRVSPSFGVRWLGPRVKSFLDQNPDWSVRVDATPEFTDFETEIVDLDLRYGSDPRSGMHEVCVMQDFILPMCSPAYLETLRAFSDDPMEQLCHAQLIDSVKTFYRWDVWLNQRGGATVPSVYALRFDRSSMAIQLAADGAGVTLESAVLAWRELATGALVPLSDRLDVIEFSGYHVVCPPRHTNRRIVRLFTEWMLEEGGRHEAEVRTYLTDRGCPIVLEGGPAQDWGGGEGPARPMPHDAQ